MNNSYTYALSVTSQFYYCGLPLRLDAYSHCGFHCLYCFAHARGGKRESSGSVADPEVLRRALSHKKPTAVGQFLSRRQPIHFGGMSDPFPPLERRLRVSLQMLRILAEHSYPTIISTKSDLFAEDEYMEVLKQGNFVVQVSLNSPDETLSKRVDIGTPGPSRLLRALRVASSEGIATACRIQPVLPGREEDAVALVGELKDAGVRHVAAEYLKLPIERAWSGTTQMSEVLGVSLLERYQQVGERVGREWILPVEMRLGIALRLREEVHAAGMTFGAADNDLLLLSDGACCCSGGDLLLDTNAHYKCTYVEAARRGLTTGRVDISSISEEWRPDATIARFINSRSRLPTRVDGRGAGIWEYLESSWNGRPNGNSPTSLYGVVRTGEKDETGFEIYEFEPHASQLYASV